MEEILLSSAADIALTAVKILIDSLLAFPVGVYTALLLAVLAYWLLVLVGLFDLDMLGLGDGIIGGEGTTGLSGVMGGMGLGGVPLSVSLSILILWSWVLTLLGQELLLIQLDPGLQDGLGLLLVLLAPGVGIFLTQPCLRPLRPLFHTHLAPRKHSYVGQLCSIASMSVTERHGQAYLEDGGAGLILSVCCRMPNSLTRGAPARIVDYDAAGDVFVVEPPGLSLIKKRT